MSQTVHRAIAIINYLSQGSRSLIEVTDLLETHKSTALRLLQTLEKEGFARRTRDARWVVGPKLIQIGQQSLDSLDARAAAGPYLRQLEKICGHTIHLAQLIGKEVIYIDKIEGSDRVRMYSSVGKKVPIYASGIGKCIFAYVEDLLMGEILESLEFEKYTSRTIMNQAELLNERKLIRKNGWAIDDGEFELGMNCIAAPIYNGRGQVRAGLSITTLQVVSPISKLKKYIPDLLATAQEISKELGWKPGKE
jgi:DNA-binding IclR family transcriptional regulator